MSNHLFSVRHGYAGDPLDPPIRTDAPISLRNSLFAVLVQLGRHTHDRFGIALETPVCNVIQRPVSHDGFKTIEKIISACDWHFVYSIIEAVYRFIRKLEVPPSHEVSNRFCYDINEIFREQNIGWRLLDGILVVHGDEAQERALVDAIGKLNQNGRATAASHIQSAIKALSERPKANTSGAVSHATSSVECVLHDITGQTLSLGKYLDKYSTLFHPALKKSLDGVYGYASDAGARHGKEGIEPTFGEAQFAVTTCAAACTLLTTTNPRDKS